MHAHFANLFAQWYISAFMIGFGILTLVRTDKMVDTKCFFKRDLRDAEVGLRIQAILEKRRRIEAFPRAGYWIIGGVAIVLGIATAFHLILPVISYANLCLIIAITLGIAFLRMRNTNVRRAASLVPRSALSAVHGLWYGCAAIASLLPLVFIGLPGLRVAAILVSLSSITIVVISIRIAGMASILPGDDAELEVLVDERLRSGRVATMLIYAYTVPFVFFGMGTAAAVQSFYQSFAYAWSGAFFLAYGCWYAFMFLGAIPSLRKTQWHATV